MYGSLSVDVVKGCRKLNSEEPSMYSASHNMRVIRSRTTSCQGPMALLEVKKNW